MLLKDDRVRANARVFVGRCVALVRLLSWFGKFYANKLDNMIREKAKQEKRKKKSWC